MVRCARLLILCVSLFCLVRQSAAADARFDLLGPKISMKVTRAGVTLPIASVPNLQPGDKIWLFADLPPSQSVHYLLICAFLRGTTNPPPDSWFIRIPTWEKKIKEEGSFITVPEEAQQAVLFLAPETGGDFSTLKSAVQGRPGVFVRASQDLAEAGFEQARIEKYLASIRRVAPADSNDLQKHSALLARTLALKPNDECFKRQPDTQFTCLTQTGTQTLLDDGHGQNIAAMLSTGPSSDLIQAASYTSVAGGGLYSAYVGAIVDLVRLMGNIHTAQYQYIPAIAFPQNDSMNLRLNTPPSFHNPKSVMVIGLPSIQSAQPPPLRPADASQITCLLRPTITLPIEGAPLVFSTSFAHDLVLHLNTPPGTVPKPDIPLTPDAFQGGLVLQQEPAGHKELRESKPLTTVDQANAGDVAKSVDAKQSPNLKPLPDPVMLTGTIQGRWGFDPFIGPTVQLQELPGEDWHIVSATGEASKPELIAGETAQLYLTSSGTACVHNITAQPTGTDTKLSVSFKPKLNQPNLLAVTLPLDHDMGPGDLHLAVQQYGQPKADELSTRTFSEPAHVANIELRAKDKSLILVGTHLDQIDKVTVGDLVFRPTESGDTPGPRGSMRMALPDGAPVPPTKPDERLKAQVILRDGRVMPVQLTVSASRPSVTLLSKSVDAGAENTNTIAVSNSNDVPLASRLTFTLKSPTSFPRDGRIEVQTLDGTLRTVLTLAPSGGLLLQDPKTVVATLDPLRSFGPSAFGPIHLRAVFPKAPAKPDQGGADSSASKAPEQTDDSNSASSDWVPLATLVRLPTLTRLQCPTDLTLPCTLTGTNLFLIDSISNDPAFENPVAVPDGFTGTTLTVPHVAASTIFLHLRDDPTTTNSAVLQTVLPNGTAAEKHTHGTHVSQQHVGPSGSVSVD